MPILNIDGININFPFEPYDVQKVYMRSVINSLQHGFNAVLESPTGTGKTLSLLCSSLAWQETRKAHVQASYLRQNNTNENLNQLQNELTTITGSSWGSTAIPKIIYTSRTHSQLTQVVRELKRTNYAYCKASILGSRHQLCIHKDVVEEPNTATKVHMCHALLKNRQCVYHNNLENSTQEESCRSQILDIEELVAVGNKSKICPYYFARSLKTTADIIFMPYNYIIDPKARKAQGIELEGNVIIFDEAHNIESNCEDAASCELHARDIAGAIAEVTSVMDEINKLDEGIMDEEGDAVIPQFNLSELAVFKTRLLELEKQIAAHPVNSNSNTLPGSFIFDLFSKAEIFVENIDHLSDLIDRIIEYLSNRGQGAFRRKGQALSKFHDAIKIVFNQDIPKHLLKEYANQYYRVHIDEEKKQEKTKTFFTTKPGRVLSYWCFTSALCMRSLESQKVHCVIITSGTLSPLEQFKSELQIPIQVSLENGHVIGDGQVWAGVVSRGPDETPLNSSYEKRSEKFIDSLGRSLINFSRVIPGGILVFFPSYGVMASCRDRWSISGTWEKISELKIPIVEPSGKNDFQIALKQYSDIIEDPTKTQGAIFFAVFRGKVSEGLDFADASGRAVIVAGIPFANTADPRVQNKRKYLNEVYGGKNSGGLNGQQWYFLQAIRAVNQAVGRIIRHKNDYGAVILCDERFNNPSTTNALSTWMKPYINSYDNFGRVLKGLKTFFVNAEKMLPQPKNAKRQLQQHVSISYDLNPTSKAQSDFSSNISSAKWRTSSQDAPSNNIDDDDLAIVYAKGPGVNCDDKMSSPSVSCLDALDNEGTKCNITCLNLMKKKNTTKENKPCQSLPPSRQKKIVIKRKHEQVEENSIKSDETAEKQTRNTRENLKRLIIKAKQNMSSTEFAQLQANVRVFNVSSCDFSPLVSLLGTTFLNKPSLSNLFYEFRDGIPETRLADYDKAVKQYLKIK